MKRPWLSVLLLFGLFMFIVFSLYMMGYAAQKSDRFGELYIWLLLFNVVLLVILAITIIYRFVTIFYGLIVKAEGAKLTWRLVSMFIFASLVPVLLVWAFSVKFLTSGIDSWFDVQIEDSLEDALELSQRSLDFRMKTHLEAVEKAVAELVDMPDMMVGFALNEHRRQVGAVELNLLGASNRIIATSSEFGELNVPKFPSEDMLVQLNRGNNYVGLEPSANNDLLVRVIAKVRQAGPAGKPRVLTALFPVPHRISALADRVQQAYGEYRSRDFLRQPLKQSFRLTLSLVLLLSALFAMWAALYMAKRLLQPIYDLASATRAVADGDYRMQLPVVQQDDLGFLVRSFNEMTQRIRKARDAEATSQRMLEGQRSYLQAVLSHLSSGVLTLDGDLRIRTANETVNQLLEIGQPLETYVGEHIADIARSHAVLQAFYDQLLAELIRSDNEWSREIRLFGDSGRKILICHGVALASDAGGETGQVIVIDDVTDLIKAQRDAAWAEVARRLAHEIKNPLTPIQLSAERMEHKLAKDLQPEQAALLQRSTQTIIKQVDAMKDMVNTFRDYASNPPGQYELIELNTLIREVMDLYIGYHNKIRISQQLDPDLPLLYADASRLRQVLHNLIRNALDSIADAQGHIEVETEYVESSQGHYVELRLQDNGPGISADLLDQLFEPYVTNKAKGTGLGLAIVAKIVEEHGGVVSAHNRNDGGACFTLRLPDKGARESPTPSPDDVK